MNFEKTKKLVTKQSNNVNKKDLHKLIAKEERLFSMLNGILSSVSSDVKIMFNLAKDYYDGTYKNINWNNLSVIVFALIYLLMPIDVIPDFIPIFGYTDDITVISVCLKMVSDELKEYKKWLEKD
ncbi:MAG: YkvA family protein [Alphaproteobacteria bacterium]